MISAELIDSMGSDLTVVNAARVSFDKESEWSADGLKMSDAKLILYLARHNHSTPFTHPQITLRETVPIFVARQRFKHVVGFTYNEISRRYVDSTPEFYEPEAWRKKADNKKQGSSDEPITRLTEDLLILDPTDGDVHTTSRIDLIYRDVLVNCLDTYEAMLASGVCPEQARMVLPQSMVTSYYVTGSLSAFARAYKLRIDSHSQKEIQDLAKEWDRIIRPLFPVSWSALVD